MKRIVNGVTYNTETSTCLATATYEPEEGQKVVTDLYQTRGGAYFEHRQTTSKEWNEAEREYDTTTRDRFIPLSPEKAHDWLMEGDVDVFTNPFDDPPEAAAEAEPGATIYLRVPGSLKRSVDEAAKADGLSGNIWAQRCLERCLQARAQA